MTTPYHISMAKLQTNPKPIRPRPNIAPSGENRPYGGTVFQPAPPPTRKPTNRKYTENVSKCRQMKGE